MESFGAFPIPWISPSGRILYRPLKGFAVQRGGYTCNEIFQMTDSMAIVSDFEIAFHFLLFPADDG